MYGLFQFITRHLASILFFLLEIVSLSLAVKYNEGPNYSYNSSKAGIGQYVASLHRNFTDYFSLGSAVKSLQKENAELRNRLYNYSLGEYQFIDSLGLDSTTDRYTVTPAQVISVTTDREKNHLVLDAGTKDGLDIGMGVIGTGGGVIGVITHVNESYSKAQSVLSTEVNLSVKLDSSEALGTMNWRPWDTRYVHIENVPKHYEVVPGEEVITSGASFIFPPNVTIGVVDKVSLGKGAFDLDILVRLHEDVTNARRVSVIHFMNKPVFP